MRKILIPLSIIGAIALFLGIMSFYTDDNSSLANDSERKNFNLPQVIQAPLLPTHVDFCGEPLNMNDFDQKERLDLEIIANSYRHSSTILYLKRAAKYFPTIEKILAEEGVPDDLKYLAVAESSLSNAVSPAGAKGFWQFMKGTGKEKGLIIDGEVDERLHLEKSTRAACKYLKELKDEFGTWKMAAAAYNMGGANLRKNKKLQGARSYFDLNVNQETMRYVFRIVAIKILLKNPTAYGFHIYESEKYAPLPPTYNVEVNKPVPSWANFAQQYGISYRKLKVFNPWLADNKLTNKARRTYYVKIPR